MAKEQLVSAKEAIARFEEILLPDSMIELAGAGLTDADRARYRKDPVAFSREILGGDPYKDQQDIMISVRDNTRTSVRSCHGVGKTWSAADIVLWFLCCFVPSSVVSTAPTARQVRDILWKEIATQYDRAKKPLGGRLLTQQLTMSTKMTWFATGFSTDEHNVDAFQGFHNDNILVVVDEACGVAPNIYAAIEGLLSAGTTVRLLMIGNPNNENTEFGASQKSPLYTRFHLSAFNSPNFTTFGITLDDIRTTHHTENGYTGDWAKKITGPMPRPYLVQPQWVAERWVVWGEESPLWKVRVMGDFPGESSDMLIPLPWIEQAVTNNALKPDGIKVLAADIARSGSDSSVMTKRHGSVILSQRTWVKRDTMQSTATIRAEIDSWQPDKVNVDVIGIGAGVVDRLKELEYEVCGVNVGDRSSDRDKFFNLRSELYWNLRDLLSRGELKLPDDDELQGDLTSFKYSYTSKGQLKLESKEDTKKRIGRSPDKADSLVLSLHIGRNTVAIGDLSAVGAYDEKKNTDPATATDTMQKVYDIITMTHNRVEECINCGTAAGVVFSNRHGNANIDDATKAKCLICKAEWEMNNGKTD